MRGSTTLLRNVLRTSANAVAARAVAARAVWCKARAHGPSGALLSVFHPAVLEQRCLGAVGGAFPVFEGDLGFPRLSRKLFRKLRGAGEGKNVDESCGLVVENIVEDRNPTCVIPTERRKCCVLNTYCISDL